MKLAGALLIAAIAAFLPPVQAGNMPRIAIIIDDLGYQQAVGERVIALPGPVACAVLPGSPRGAALARAAHTRGKEVLLHLPMQALGESEGGEGGSLTLDMSRDELKHSLDAALLEVPFAIGVSNHRGSLLTRHPGHMRWLMEEILHLEPLFFVDSYTTHLSVALQLASETGVRAVKRDVFLDNDQAPEMIRGEFERLKRLARSRGVAVAIGHPHAATLAVLEELLPGLADEGILLVPVSELVANSR
jgi:hypothetical protein